MLAMQHEERAPAKINLSLRVLGKRDDGFHELETLMVAVEGVEDELRFALGDGRGDVRLVCDDESVPTGEENLVLMALRGFERETGLRFEGESHWAKRIPHGAGLGGGSSDAAAVLRALNSISGADLDLAKLCELAAEIGSDVAFFVRGEPSICRGRGEVIEPLADALPAQRIILAKPAFAVPSGWAYSRWAESVELPGVDYAPQAASWGVAVNDLERPVFEKHLALAALKTWLQDASETGVALMSGSGSTVFATLGEGADGAALAERLGAEFGDSTWVKEAAIASPSRR